MSDNSEKLDNKKCDDVLAKMLKTKPKVNQPLTKSDAKEKPNDSSGKIYRSED
jgi:hypothetical protein